MTAEVSLKPCIKCSSVMRYLDGTCKNCKKHRDAERRINNRDKLNAATAAWRKDNPEKAKAGVLAWRRKNPMRQKAINAAFRLRHLAEHRGRSSLWAKRNPERHNANTLAWARANPAKARATSSAWEAKNSERRKTNSAAWAKANKELKRIYRHTRRARILKTGGVLSIGLSNKLFKLQKGKCACCGNPLGSDYHLDHINPLVLGGLNTDNNIQLLRKRCNHQKSAKDPIKFMQQRGFLL